MEKRYQHLTNGQSVLKDDLNVLGEASSLADDRVFAEMFRMQPYDGSTVRKGVLPYRHAASANAALVAANGASGSVLVNPFRAFVGTRTAVATDAKLNLRDVRSALSVGSTTLAQTVAIGANASGNPRWDLVYAAVAVDANSASVSRKVKDPTTKAISAATLVTTLETTVTLGVVAGTAAASPVWPTIPADSGGTYYVPLAHVRVPTGFGASSTVLATDIAIVAPCLGMSDAVGGSVSPPTEAVALPTAKQQSWGSTGTRPGRFMPSSMTGKKELLLYLDLYDASSTNWSHASGDTLDSRDWRGRFAKWTCAIDDAPSATPWRSATFETYGNFPGDEFGGVDIGVGFDVTTNDLIHGMAHSIGAGASGQHLIIGLDSDRHDVVAGTILNVYVDAADGKLKFSCNPTMTRRFFIWLEFSGPFENA
ncbi:MAG: hypothetical protein JWM74_29 [Myxococcaceae bacterium]|nr:hypothetical protein [Myxococcaceae bacterium]